jgi:arylsulfatase A-like enzyme
MQAAGYRTCFIGKYHLGESAPTLHTPTGYTYGDQPGRGPVIRAMTSASRRVTRGAPPASYFAVLNQNAGAAPDEYTFELLDLDDTSYLLPGDAAVPASGDYLNDRLTDKAIGFIDDAISTMSHNPST